VRIVPQPSIRPARAEDRDPAYEICLRTGDSGADATEMYADPRLIGEIWVGPYLTLEPDLAFVAEDADGVLGYVLGAADTPAFEALCEREWWPPLRIRYPTYRTGPEATPDDHLIEMIHHPPRTPAAVAERFPAHLHVDILARGQGRGLGRLLLQTLFDALVASGASGVHLGVGADNANAIGFYRHLGFEPAHVPEPGADELLLGMRLPAR
jgi:ribosomal protein S18 acetylase RimI-like enzyme